MSERVNRKSTDNAAVSFNDVTDELYGLAPEEFTATRTRYEKRARQAGDRELAARVHALAKPSVTAWLANQLARERQDELAALSELGANLRGATERLAGNELRRLSRQQNELVHALVEQAKQLARASGHSVSEDTVRGLEDTLHAALADEHAGEQLLAGRLTKGLRARGFGDTAAPESGSTVRESPQPAQRREPHGNQDMRRAERDLAEANRVLADATRARDDAQADATDADQAAQAAEGQVEVLRRQLDEARAATVESDRRRRERTTAFEEADKAVRDAKRRQADAQRRRDRLASASEGDLGKE